MISKPFWLLSQQFDEGLLQKHQRRRWFENEGGRTATNCVTRLVFGNIDSKNQSQVWKGNYFTVTVTALCSGHCLTTGTCTNFQGSSGTFLKMHNYSVHETTFSFGFRSLSATCGHFRTVSDIFGYFWTVTDSFSHFFTLFVFKASRRDTQEGCVCITTTPHVSLSNVNPLLCLFLS